MQYRIMRKSEKVYKLMEDGIKHLISTQNYEMLTLAQIKEVAKKIKELK